MIATIRYKLAICFAILFIIIVVTPAVVLTFDDNIEIAIFFGENDEGEKENLKLVFDSNYTEHIADTSITLDKTLDYYDLKNYPKPQINPVSPPPELS